MNTIEVSWEDSDKSILLIEFCDGWTDYDFTEMIQQTSPRITAKPHKVHVFVDFRKNFAIPKLVISIINSSKQYFSDNVGLIAVITPSLIVRHMYETIKPILSLRYTIVFADDKEDAYRLLKEYKERAGQS